MKETSGSDGMTVVVASGDIMLREPLVAYLRDCGYRVIVAATTKEAIDILQAGETADYVLVDVHTSGKVDGFAISQWVRRNSLSTRVILSASIEKTARAAGDLCEDGPEEVKSFDPRSLEQRMRQSRASGRL